MALLLHKASEVEMSKRITSVLHMVRQAHAVGKASLLVGSAFAVGLAASVSASLADEAAAKSIFKAMSDYLAAQTAISFDYNSTLEIVTTDGQKVGLASSGTLNLSRPDKIRVTRTGGFADVELVFDGATLSLLGKNINAYAQLNAPGTV